MLWKHGGRNSTREDGEHSAAGTGGSGPGVGVPVSVGVAEHGGQHGGVRGAVARRLGEVLGQRGRRHRARPRDGGQLEEVLGEGGVVVRQPGQEREAGHQRDRE